MVAVSAVVLTRGSLLDVARLPVRSTALLAAGLALQVALEFADFPKNLIEPVGFPLLMLSYACVLAFCILNLPIRGMTIVTIGIAMNALVIGLNQGMPAKDEPVTLPSGREVLRPIERTVKYVPSTDDDVLHALGDIIRFPEPFNQTTVSFGDLVLAVGLCDVCYHAGRRTRSRRGTVSSWP